MYKAVFMTIILLITSPHKAWRQIETRKEVLQVFLNRFLHPVFGIIALTSFVGGLWILPDGNLQSALKLMIVTVVTVFGGFYIASYLTNELLSRFKNVRLKGVYQVFIGYSSVMLYMLFIIYPLASNIPILWLLSLYTVYIVYTGAKIYCDVNEKVIMNFTTVMTAIILLVPAIIFALMSFLIK